LQLTAYSLRFAALRSRFRARLKPGVEMTASVKGCVSERGACPWSEVLDGLWEVRQAPWAMAADRRRRPGGPGPRAEGPAGERVARGGAAAVAAACATGVRTGGEPQSAPERSGVLTTAQVAARGEAGDGHRARDATPRLERRDDGGQTPPLDRLPAGGLRALAPCLLCRHGAAGCLDAPRRRGRGPDHGCQPAPLGWPPGGPALIPKSLSPPAGLQPGRGGLAIPAGIRSGAAAVAESLVLARGDSDGRQLAGAHAPGPRGRRAASGGAAVARRLWDQRGGHDPAEPWRLGARTLPPGPAGSRVVAQDQRWRCRGARADALITVALAGPETPPEDDRCRPRLVARGDGDGVLVHIQPDDAWGRVRQG